MTPHEYQTFALSTYCAPDHIDRTDYLHHLLIEEVGEVMSLFAKSMRDGHGVDRDRLVSELGDVLWCVAFINLLAGNRWDASIEWPISMCSIEDVQRRAIGTTIRSAQRIIDYRQHSNCMNDQLVSLADLIGSCDPTLTLEEVAIANVAKLTSRRDRGVLKGSGDDR